MGNTNRSSRKDLFRTGLDILDGANCFTKMAGDRVSVPAQSALIGGHRFIR